MPAAVATERVETAWVSSLSRMPAATSRICRRVRVFASSTVEVIRLFAYH